MSTPTRPFPPQIDDRGTIRAGGVTLGELRPDGTLVLPDRWQRRCEQRGTPDVPVDLLALLEEILYFYAIGPGA